MGYPYTAWCTRSGMNDLTEKARRFVGCSEDRMLVWILVGEDRIDLAPQPTLEMAKAQWSDAVWIVEKLLALGAYI